MEHVDAADVGVGAEAEAFREAGRFRGVGTQLDDVRGGEGDGVDFPESSPGCVDGGTGVLAEDRGRVRGDKRTVSFDFQKGDVDLVEDWGFKIVSRCSWRGTASHTMLRRLSQQRVVEPVTRQEARGGRDDHEEGRENEEGDVEEEEQGVRGFRWGWDETVWRQVL